MQSRVPQSDHPVHVIAAQHHASVQHRSEELPAALAQRAGTGLATDSPTRMAEAPKPLAPMPPSLGSQIAPHLTPQTSLTPEDLQQRYAEALRLAIEAFPKSSSWVDFFRDVLGVDGVARRLFTSAEQMHQWEASTEFSQVLEMMTALRAQETSKCESAEPQRMITVRIPMSLHESLKKESEDHRTSINKLCISKLLVGIDNKYIPAEKGRLRGRKPGPQGPRRPKTMGEEIAPQD
jgi:predicted HicB family RNase H-like nuclease